MVVVRPISLLLPAIVLVAQAAEAPKPPSDAQVEAIARKALASTDSIERRSALQIIKAHHFKSSLIKEREFVLYAQGILEDRLGESVNAAVTFKKLERTWPNSSYLSEAQIPLAAVAVDRRRFKEAEPRLRRALQADIPVESKRRAQELLLWTLVEQNRGAEGLAVVKALFPLPGNDKPTERGLVAMTEVLCQAKEREQAEAAWKDLHAFYPNSALGSRADLAWARLLGAEGQSKHAADLFRKIITEKSGGAEADEARLALATLLSEGKLKPKEMEGFPTAQRLLEELKHSEHKGDLERRALVVQLRLYMGQSQWKEAMDAATQLRTKAATKEQGVLATSLRAEAFRAWIQQALNDKRVGPLLTYLDAEGIESLAAPQRLGLARQLAQSGLPGAIRTLIQLSPPKERDSLRKAALESMVPGTHAEETLGLLPSKGETPAESLHRAQALASLHRWEEVRAPLGRALPGAERITILVSFLQRPSAKGETPGARLKEAEGWLARSREKGTLREPLVILVADLRVKGGDWRGALNLYPEEAAPENRGWVALMRATCQWKLGRLEAAKTTLKAATDVPGFKMERQTLAKQLGQ